MKRISTAVVLAVMAPSSPIWAQCVMCFRTAAAQQAERSRVLNEGIVILLIPPILVLAGILWWAFRKNRPSSTL